MMRSTTYNLTQRSQICRYQQTINPTTQFPHRDTFPCSKNTSAAANPFDHIHRSLNSQYSQLLPEYILLPCICLCHRCRTFVTFPVFPTVPGALQGPGVLSS